MSTTYTMSEVRARFPEVLRRVREGATVTVTRRGDPVAEIHPIESEIPSIEERFDELERRGILTRARGPRAPLTPGDTPVPGTLDRFLADRNRY